MIHEEAISILRNTAWLGSVDDLEKVEEALQYFDDIESNDRIHTKCIGIGTQNVSESDSISRQAAKEAYCDHFCHRGVLCPDTGVCREVDEAFDSIPSAQPEDYTELKREFLRMASYIDVLLECSDVQKETLIGFISRLAEFMPWTERD